MASINIIKLNIPLNNALLFSFSILFILFSKFINFFTFSNFSDGKPKCLYKYNYGLNDKKEVDENGKG
jgi:hypothetical protein